MLKQFHKNKVFSRLMLVATMIGLTGFAAFAADTPAGQTPETAKVIPGEFTNAKAMYLIFGNYNPLTEESETTITNKQAEEYQFFGKPPKDPSAPETAASEQEPEVDPNGPFPVLVSTKLSKRFWDKTGERQVILFAVTVEEYDCHSCAPVVAGALFTKMKDGWRLDSFSEYIAQIGSWGKIPPIASVKLGTNRFGFSIKDKDRDPCTTVSFLYLISEVNGKLAVVFKDPDFEGSFEPIMDLRFPAYAFNSQYFLRRRSGQDWFDLKVVTRGTKLEQNDNDDTEQKRISANQTRKFAFKDGQYRPVE